MQIKKIYFGALFLSAMASAQVGINTDDPKVTLQIDANTQQDASKTGILIPRVTQNPANGQANGQLIYNTTDYQFYYWNGTKWLPISNSIVNNNNAQLNAKFVDSRTSTEVTMNNTSPETLVTGVSLEFTLDSEKSVQFYSTVNFAGVSSSFAPLFKLKLTKLEGNTNASATGDVIDQASNTFLSDGISTYYGNLPLMTIKKLSAGKYKAEVFAYYNTCCNYDFTYKVGGSNTPVSLLIQYP